MKKLGTVIVIALAIWFIYANWADFEPNTIAGIFVALFTGLVAIRGYSETKKREIVARHFSEKKNVYMKFIDMLIKVLKGQKEETPVEQEDLVEAMYNFRGEMIIWGGADTINAFDKYIKNAELDDTTGECDPLLVVDDLLRAMRKELGHNDDSLKRGRIVGMLLDVEGKKLLDGLAK